MAPLQLSHADTRRLVELLARQAVAFPAGPESFYRDLVTRSRIPVEWKQQQAGGWTGDTRFDARRLIAFTQAKGTVPGSGGYAALGSVVVMPLLEQDGVGVEDAAELAAIASVYELAPPDVMASLRARFAVPVAAAGTLATVPDLGPPIAWRGPTDAVELQSWFTPEPPMLDVGFLTGAVRSAAAVCRIELPDQRRSGTGVRIADDLIVTNHHVMQQGGEVIEDNCANAVISFCAWSGGDGGEGERRDTRLAPVPLCHVNPALDYVILRLSESGRALPGAVSRLADVPVRRRDAVHILHHPVGGVMKLAISANGVTDVSTETGFIQYVASTAGGSSGAPCFNERWEVVAIHHAQRACAFGRVGEGVMIQAIRPEIESLLTRRAS